MSRAKKILLIVLFLILLSQIPFAYRRYRLGRLNALIQMINSESRQLAQSRTRQSNDLSPYAEYKGVVHVHSFLGGHSAGTFQEILDGAIANQLDFVVMTEHVESQYDTSAMTLKGPRAGVLFINGNEVASKQGDRLLSIPGDVSLTSSSGVSTADVVANSRARNALSIIAYPEEFKSWSENVDGIEVYNVYTNARRINPLVALFDTVWSRRAFPALLFANYLQKPGLGLKKWDEILAGRRAVALAGNDSHSNVGLSLDDASGKQLVGLKLDPYETSFRLVRVHVLLPAQVEDSMEVRAQLDETSLLQAIRAGHCFIGFDLLGDTTNFRFEVRDSRGIQIQGDEVPLQSDTRLKILLPASSRLVLYRNGSVMLDETGVKEKEIPVVQAGIYRVEGYLPQLGKPFSEQPWIISNPIYIK
ncbi:MAG: hypothetical protein DMF69_08505 [Acidobacteria bacterium]|nr:MAG: hypothetical protein DMF69_08505 [Acidobacteriota bacterium]